MRAEAFAQSYAPTPVDRFGVWLSARQIRRWIPDFRGKRVADFGCGFHAAFARTVLGEASSVTLVDVALAEDLKSHPRVQASTRPLLEVLPEIPDASLDVVMCISVLEHLAEPLPAIQHFQRILAPGGTCLLNVPSWRGKRALEYSAFRLKTSPAFEMNDHKMYYDVRDLWPLLVKAGFVPQDIHCFTHKFGLNTFAACGKARGEA